MNRLKINLGVKINFSFVAFIMWDYLFFHLFQENFFLLRYYNKLIKKLIV